MFDELIMHILKIREYRNKVFGNEAFFKTDLIADLKIEAFSEVMPEEIKRLNALAIVLSRSDASAEKRVTTAELREH